VISRAATQPNTPAPAPVVLTIDDHEIELPIGFTSAFVGGDLFFVKEDYALARLAASSDTPADVRQGVDAFQVIQGASNLLVVFPRFASADAIARSTLLETTTLHETTLPVETGQAQSYVASETGRFIATEAGPQSGSVDYAGSLTIFDRDTGAQTLFRLPDADAFLSLLWRPRHDEVWFATIDQMAQSTEAWRWLPGGTPSDAGGADAPGLPPFASASPQRISAPDLAFTPDGRFRIVSDHRAGVRGLAALESPDGDALAPLPLNPDGTAFAGAWPLPDGRLIVEDWITDPLRSDMYLVDGDARTFRALESSGYVVATGRDRFLAVLRYVAAGGSGDLTLVDLVAGTETLIAENVSSVSVDLAPDADDALAPGTRVAYLVHNRIASPYDGLWVFDLP
jgi:hypothetical protein